MFRKALRPAALPLLLVLAAAAAPAQPGDDVQPAATPQPCITDIARAFNGVVPLLGRVPRDAGTELGPVIARLNSLRSRIMDGLDAAAPTEAACEGLAQELATQRHALQALLPAAVPAEPLPVPSPAPVVTAPLAEPASPPAPAPLALSLPSRPAAQPRPPERRALAAVPTAPVKKAAYALPPPAPAPRVDPQLEACKAQVRQTHADVQMQLQQAARGGRIAQQKLQDMQRTQGRLAGLSSQVRRDFETLGECQQVSQALVQEVGNVQALAR